MAYSIDLRKRVVSFIRNGGTQKAATELFSVSLWCVRDWCKRDKLKASSPPGRPRKKLDWEALRRDIQVNPDKLLRERAKEHNVRINAIWYASKQMNISHKKND